MDSVPEEINLREQIQEIVRFLVDVFHRLRERSGEDDFLLRWRPTCLRRDRTNKSVVRWLGNHMPACLGWIPCGVDYKAWLDAVFREKSLVREIGSRLPLQPSKRPYFYILHQQAIETHSTKLKGSGHTQFVHSTPRRNSISPASSIVWEGSNESCQENTFNQSLAGPPDDTVRKITALEDELNRLRAQIAGFVLKQEDPATTHQKDLAPPPPPPPPPLPSVSCFSTPQTKKPLCKAAVIKDDSVFDMTAILKDLNQVKLRAVKRSPGGTPVRRAPRQTKGNDPASIIAFALKNKFAKSRMAVASPADKENLRSNSPGNSFSNTPSPQPNYRKPQERMATMSQAKESPPELINVVTPVRG